MPFKSNIRYPFVDWVIRGAPDDPGVYALYRGDELIYYGSAHGEGATIHACLRNHLEGNGCTASATHYSWELSRDPLARERELLLEHQAQAKRLPRCNRSSG